MLNLKHNITFHELYKLQGLSKLDNAFKEYLKSIDQNLHNSLLEARKTTPDAESELIIALAPTA